MRKRNFLNEMSSLQQIVQKVIVVFLVTGLFSGCLNTIEQYDNSIQFQDYFTIDTIKIKLDNVSLNYYNDGVCIFQCDNLLYLAAYNRRTHSIDWFNISEGRLEQSIQLERQGPNQILDIIDGIHVYSFDSIFINDSREIAIINKEGNVISRINNEFETEIGLVTFNSKTTQLSYCAQNNCIIGEIVVINQSLSKKTPLFMSYELCTGSVQIFTVPISKSYINNNNFNNWVNATFRGDSIIYNFTSCSNAYMYNTRTGEYSSYNLSSRLSKNKKSRVSSHDSYALWKNYIENPHFFQIEYWSTYNIYYRLHWKELQYSINSTPYEKDIIISLCDSQMKPSYETILPSKTYLTGNAFITNYGLMLNANHPEKIGYDPNTMELHFLNLRIHNVKDLQSNEIH